MLHSNAKKDIFSDHHVHILWYIVVKAIGGLNLSRGGVRGLRFSLGTEKIGRILANIKTTAEAKPFIFKKETILACGGFVSLKCFLQTILTLFFPRNHRRIQFGPKHDCKSDLLFVRHFARKILLVIGT